MWIQAIRVGHRSRNGSILTRFLHDIEHAGDSAAAGTALHCSDEQYNFPQWLAVSRLSFLLQVVHADIRWNRIEAATIDDARTALLRTALVRVDHLADPLPLAGEVAIVRALRNACRDQRRCRILRTGRRSSAPPESGPRDAPLPRNPGCRRSKSRDVVPNRQSPRPWLRVSAGCVPRPPSGVGHHTDSSPRGIRRRDGR